MELNKVEKLLESYFEGNLNEQEELVLHNYFSQEKVADHLKKYQPLFGFFAQERSIESQKGFKILSAKTSSKNRNFFISIAASLLVLLGVSVFTYNNFDEPIQNELGTYKSPEVALVEAQKALNLISKHVNTGYKSVQVIEEYEITKNKIFNVN